MATPPPGFNPDKQFCFVEVPAVGYALNVHPRAFGFVGQQENPPTALFLSNETKRSELENIIAQEAKKTTWQAVYNGVGGNSKYYPPSAGLLLAICSAGFLCPLHVALALFAVPVLAVPRMLQKASVDKMGAWVKKAPVYEARVKPLEDYIGKEGIEKKVAAYATAVNQLGFAGQLKSICSEPAAIQKQRTELAHDFDHLYKLSLHEVFENLADYRYPFMVTKDIYAFMRNVYEKRWMKKQNYVLFSSSETECECHDRSHNL